MSRINNPFSQEEEAHRQPLNVRSAIMIQFGVIASDGAREKPKSGEEKTTKNFSLIQF